jgi:hypothetical protein
MPLTLRTRKIGALVAALTVVGGVLAWLVRDHQQQRRVSAERDAVALATLICENRWPALWDALTPAYQAANKDPDALRDRLERVEGDVASAGRTPVLWDVVGLGEGMWRAELRLETDAAEQQIALSLIFGGSPARIARIEAMAATANMESEPPVRAVRALMQTLRTGQVERVYEEVGQPYHALYTPELHADLMREQGALLGAPVAELRQVSYNSPDEAVIIAHHSAASGEQGLVVYSVGRQEGGAWKVTMFGVLMAADRGADPAEGGLDSTNP